MIFLIEYDRSAGKIVFDQEFRDTDRGAAQQARLARELELNSRKIAHEVVLLEAENKAALLETHRRYFQTGREFVTASMSSPILSKKL